MFRLWVVTTVVASWLTATAWSDETAPPTKSTTKIETKAAADPLPSSFLHLLRPGTTVTLRNTSFGDASPGYLIRIYSKERKQEALSEYIEYRKKSDEYNVLRAELQVQIQSGDRDAQNRLNDLRSDMDLSRRRRLLREEDFYKVIKVGRDYVALREGDTNLYIQTSWIRGITQEGQPDPSATSDADVNPLSSDVADSDPDATSQPEQVTVFYLKNAEVRSVKDVLSQLMEGGKVLIEIDPRTNALLIRGTKEQVQQVEQFLKVLDESPGDAKRQIKIMNLNSVPDDGIEAALSLLTEGSDTRFVIDPIRRAVLLVGTEEELKKIEAVLLRLDQATVALPVSVPLHIRVVWLASGLEDAEAAATPSEFAELSEKLRRLGVGDLKMISQSILNADSNPGSVFTAQGSTEFRGVADWEIEGNIQGVRPGHAQIELAISATQQQALDPNNPRRGFDPRAARAILCELQTKINVELSKPVVVGVTPMQTGQSVFVIQVFSDGELTTAQSNRPEATPNGSTESSNERARSSDFRSRFGGGRRGFGGSRFGGGGRGGSAGEREGSGNEDREDSPE